MRKPKEIDVASRMQNMVQICAQNACFWTNLLVHFDFCTNSFGALDVESPHRWGHILCLQPSGAALHMVGVCSQGVDVCSVTGPGAFAS